MAPIFNLDLFDAEAYFNIIAGFLKEPGKAVMLCVDFVEEDGTYASGHAVAVGQFHHGLSSLDPDQARFVLFEPNYGVILCTGLGLKNALEKLFGNGGEYDDISRNKKGPSPLSRPSNRGRVIPYFRKKSEPVPLKPAPSAPRSRAGRAAAMSQLSDHKKS